MRDWLVVSNVLLWLVVLVQLAVSLAMFRQMMLLVLGQARSVKDSGIPEGKRLPAYRGQDVHGSAWSTQDMAGEAYVLLFASPTCAACGRIIRELPELQRQERVPVVTLLFAPPDAARDHVDKRAIAGTVVPVGDDEGELFDVEVTPYAYGVDAEGFVRGKGEVDVAGVRVLARHARAGTNAAVNAAHEGHEHHPGVDERVSS